MSGPVEGGSNGAFQLPSAPWVLMGLSACPGGHGSFWVLWQLPLPEEPPPGASDVEWKRHQREVKRTEKINSERHSLRADMTIKLQVGVLQRLPACTAAEHLIPPGIAPWAPLWGVRMGPMVV